MNPTSVPLISMAKVGATKAHCNRPFMFPFSHPRLNSFLRMHSQKHYAPWCQTEVAIYKH